MKKIALLTDSLALASGLARIARELCSRIHQHPEYQIWQLGWHHSGLPHNFPIQIFPIIRGQPDEKDRIFSVIANLGIHYLIAIGDPFYFSWLKDLKKKLHENTFFRQMKFIGYITIDGHPIFTKDANNLKEFDIIFSMSKFAQEQMKAHNIESTVLYPGVDKRIFKPVGVIHPNLNPEKEFIVFIVDQNTSRKAIPLAIESFYHFQKDKKDVKLFLATAFDDPNGTNLNELIDYFKIKDKVFQKYVRPDKGISDDEMNAMYNLSTVLFSMTSGEGFKLPILEAMATNTVCLMPCYTSPEELLSQDRGVLVDLSKSGEHDGYWVGTYNYKKAMPSVTDAAEKLNMLYNDWKNGKNKINQIIRNGQEFSSMYSWDATFFQMLNAIEEHNLNQKYRIEKI